MSEAQGTYTIHTFLNNSGFTTGFDKLKGMLGGGLASALGPFAAAAAGLIGIKRFIDWGDNIDNFSKRMGIATGTVQAFEYAATLSNSSLEEVGASFKFLQRAMAGAAGSKELAESFARMGISLADISSVAPEEIFMRITDSMEKNGVAGQRFNDVMNLFGRGADRLIPAFTSGWRAQVEAGKANAISPEDIQRIAQLEEAFKKFSMMMRSELGPALAFIFGQILIGTMRLQGSVAAYAQAAGYLSTKLPTTWIMPNTLHKDMWAGLKNVFFPTDSSNTTNLDGNFIQNAFKKFGKDFKTWGTSGGPINTEDLKDSFNGPLVKMQKSLDELMASWSKPSTPAVPGSFSPAKIEKATKPESMPTINTDALKKIGLFVGGDIGLNILRSQLSVLNSINSRIRDVKLAIEKI